MSRILQVGDKRAGLPVAWLRSRDEAMEAELDLHHGHPGRINPDCVGNDAPYADGDVLIEWYGRARESQTVFEIEDRDIEAISETEYAERVDRIDRGVLPV